MATISATWTRIASTARLQRSSQCFSVLGNQAWLFGGELLPRQPVDNRLDVVELDPKQESDTPTTTLAAPEGAAPTPRVGAAMATLDGALYLFSGRGGLAMAPVEENGALWRYVPGHGPSAAGQWHAVPPADPAAPYPAGRSYHAMAADSTRNALYVHAGCPEKGRLADLWAFDVRARTWMELPPAPPPARGGPSIAVCAGKLYRMNGFDGTTEQGGALDVYDPDARAWSTIAFPADGQRGPEPRSVSALVALKLQGGRDFLVTLFGERDPSSLGHAGAGKMLGDVWAFDVERSEWTKAEPGGDQPAPRGWFAADVVEEHGGHQAVVVHGGLAEDNSRLGDVWKLQFE